MNVLQVGPESALTFLIYAKVAPLVAQDPTHTTGFEKFLGGGIAGRPSDPPFVFAVLSYYIKNI